MKYKAHITSTTSKYTFYIIEFSDYSIRNITEEQVPAVTEWITGLDQAVETDIIKKCLFAPFDLYRINTMYQLN